jgi:hypothetical protein
MRVPAWIFVPTFSIVFTSCHLFFGFRDLEIESAESEGGYGGEGGGHGGYGGDVCGIEPLGTVCSDDLECGSCICEDAGDESFPESICCLETCPPCYDCNPNTGLCDIEIDLEPDPPDCDGANFCDLGFCSMG